MMHDALLPVDLLKLIKPQQVRSYAIAKGWQRVEGVNGHIALFEHPEGDNDQLIVPMEETFDDYARRLRELIENLASFERRPLSNVLNDLIMPESDILRFRIVSRATGRGSIPLNDGIRLLDGAKRSILAAACSVVNPATHHPRMARNEAQQLLNVCQMGQTERGSFSVTVACPLRAVEQEQALLEGVEPFTRQAVTVLISSAARVVQAIETDKVPDVFGAKKGEPVVSANLCEALLQMQPQDEASSLALMVSWAATLPVGKQVPTVVRIKHEYFPIFEDIARKLRPARIPSATLFIGYVENLGGEPGDDGRMQGDATLAVVHEEQVQFVRVQLSPEDWLKAHGALGDHAPVRVKGILHRGTRVHRLTDISEFARVV